MTPMVPIAASNIAAVIPHLHYLGLPLVVWSRSVNQFWNPVGCQKSGLGR